MWRTWAYQPHLSIFRCYYRVATVFGFIKVFLFIEFLYFFIERVYYFIEYVFFFIKLVCFIECVCFFIE